MANTLAIARLRENPFRLVPNDRVTVWAGYEELRTQLLDIVDSCRSDRVGLSEFAILHGDLGAGKSHALRYLRNWITSEHKDEFASPCVYLETVKVAASMSFVALYRKIMEQLIPHINETAEWLEASVEETATQRIGGGRRAERDRAANELYSDQRLTPSFPPLSLLLRGIGEGNEEPLALLLGERIGGAGAMRTYRRYNMTGPIETEYDATKCLGAYVNLCTRDNPILSDGDVVARNKAFYFFLDEVETVLDFRPQEALSLNQGLRDLINACPESCCFLLGMTGDVRDIYGLLTQAVIRRMSREPLAIAPLTTDEAVAFLKQVLRGYRTDETDPDAFPFREEALRVIAEATQIKTPSELFRGCRRVLERAVSSGALASGGMIDQEIATSTL